MALTVIEPAVETKLTTLETVWDALAISPGAADPFLDLSIDQASDAIRTWCNRAFAVEKVRETIHPAAWGKPLMLSRWPVVEITSATVNGKVENVASFEAEDSGHLLWLDAHGCRTSWPSGRIVLEYRAGYVMPGQTGRTLPNDIERAAILLVKTAYFGRDRDPQIKTETVEGVGSTSYGFAGLDRGFTLPPEVEGLLSRYRAVSVL